MKEILFVFLILFLTFPYCGYNGPVTEQAYCKHQIEYNETGLEGCAIYSMFDYTLTRQSYYIDGTPASPPAISDANSKRQLYDAVLLKCLIAVENEKKCNKKSKYKIRWESARSGH